MDFDAPASERRQSLEPGIESGADDLQPAGRCEPFAHSRAADGARYQLNLAPRLPRPLPGHLPGTPPGHPVSVGGTARHHEIRAVVDVRIGRSDRRHRDLCAIGQSLGDGLRHLLGAPEHRFVNDDCSHDSTPCSHCLQGQGLPDFAPRAGPKDPSDASQPQASVMCPSQAPDREPGALGGPDLRAERGVGRRVGDHGTGPEATWIRSRRAVPAVRPCAVPDQQRPATA
jgi:hypothetical protein